MKKQIWNDNVNNDINQYGVVISNNNMLKRQIKA